MTSHNNVNASANGRKRFFKPRNANESVNNVNVSDKYERAKKIDYIADQLVDKFGNNQYRAFYCKVAWKLSEARIWQHYETAVKSASRSSRGPGPLFTYLCKKDGV